MKAYIAAAAFAAATQAVELGSGATAAEHESFIRHLAASGTSITDGNEFNFREAMYANMDRWIQRQNADSLASGAASPVQYGHNQFSTMTPKEKAAFLGIKKKLMKWIKRWIKRMEDRMNSDSESDASESEDPEPEPASDSESEASESEASDADDNNSDSGDASGDESDDSQPDGPVSPTDPDSDDNSDVPDYEEPTVGIDWRASGHVQAIKNQGSCGSCWAFASASQLESVYSVKYGTLYNLSEQQLVDCATTGNSGCNGGFMSYVFDYYSNQHAVASGADYTYTASQGGCKASSYSGLVKSTGSSNVRSGLSSSQWKDILNDGPVSIAVSAGNNYFMNYQSGILDTTGCPQRIDHAVNMVGWGEDADGVQYWIVRNSWGTSWGEDGYIRIAMKDSGYGVCMAQYLAVVVAV